jgi:beta-glucanase (GH16 family)
MKYVYTFGCLFIILSVRAQSNKIAAGSNCKSTPVYSVSNSGCNNLPYVLAFEDNFDGTTLDTLKNWRVPYQGLLSGYDFGLSKQWYANTGSTPTIPFENNIEVSNGTLKLWAKREPTPIIGSYVTDWSTSPPTVASSNFEFSSGWIESKKKFQYGMYVIRCKIPKGKGFWPAFWTYGQGPTSNWNEIDAFEFWNEGSLGVPYDPSKLATDPNSNVHYIYNGQKNNCSKSNPGPDYSTGFHTFIVVYGEFLITWYIDGVFQRDFLYLEDNNTPVTCATYSAGQTYDVAKAFPRDPMNIFANFALQRGNSNDPNASSPFPSAFEIDYIRFYKQSDCLSQYHFSTPSQLNTVSIYPNFYKGSRLSFGNNFTFPSTQVADFAARDEIVISNDVIASAGSDLTFRIDNTLCTDVLKLGEADPHTIALIDIDTATYQNLEALTDIKAHFSEGALQLDIKSALVNTYQISVIDAMGKTVFYRADVDKKYGNRFPIANLAKGMYMVRLSDSQSGYQYKQKLLYEN